MSSLGLKKPRLDLSGEDGSGSSLRPVAVASAGTVELPMLTRANYHDWSLVMKVSLEALGLWDAVEAAKPEHREDRLALAAILCAVPTDMKASLAVKKTAKEAWAAVNTARVGDERVKQASVQRLLKEFETVVHVDGENIDDLAARIDGLAVQLRELGETMEDMRVVRKILRVVPKRYNQVACAIEMFSDLDTMTVPDLVGRLRAAEDRCINDEVATVEAGISRLLLTEEQWEMRRRQRGGKDQVHGGGRAKAGGYVGDHGDDDDGGSSTSSGHGRSRYRGKCFDCGERGHMARNCPRKKKERTLLCDVEEEPALL
ncbi:unnamed protein product [Urochloa humidicola]